MTDEFLDFIIFLENTLASFYRTIKVLPYYERAENVLEFMESHSTIHAEQIEDLKTKYPRPELGQYIKINYQNNIVSKVADQIKNEKDLPKVMKILADSEESVGDLYLKLTEYLRKLSVHYTTLADGIDSLAEDEMKHRDLLLQDMEKLKQKKKP